VRFSQALPDQCQADTVCGCRAETKDVNIFAAIKGSPSFSSNSSLFTDQPSVFLELAVDAVMGARGRVRARLYPRDLGEIKFRRKRSPGWKKWRRRAKKSIKRVVKSVKKVVKAPVRIVKPVKKIVKKIVKPVDKILTKIVKPLQKLACKRIVRKTVGFDLVSSGTVRMGVGVNFTDIRVTPTDSGVQLSFVPSFHIMGQIISWKMDQVKASDCTERLAGLKLFSYCSFLEKRARKEITKNMEKIQEVKLPAVIKKVEAKLQAKIGREVKVDIPMSYFANR